ESRRKNKRSDILEATPKRTARVYTGMSWILKKGSSNLLKLLRKHRMRLIWTFRMTASMQSKKARQKAVWQHTKSPISKRVNSGSSTIAWKRADRAAT